MTLYAREYELNNGRFIPTNCRVKFNRDGSVNLEHIIKFGINHCFLNDSANADDFEVIEKNDEYWIKPKDEPVFLFKITKDE